MFEVVLSVYQWYFNVKKKKNIQSDSIDFSYICGEYKLCWIE